MDYFYWVLFLYLGLRDVVKRLVDIIGYIYVCFLRCEYCINFYFNLIYVGMILILLEGVISINFVLIVGNVFCGYVMLLILFVY